MNKTAGLLFVCFLGLALLHPGGSIAQELGDSIKEALRELRASGANVKGYGLYKGHRRIGSLRGDLSPSSSGPPVETAYKFLEEHPLLFQTDLSKKDLTLGELRDIGQGGNRVRLDQTYKGLSVFNGGLEIFLRADNSIDLIYNYYVPDIDISVAPAIPEERIIELTWNYFLQTCQYYPGKREPYRPCPESMKSELSMSKIKVELGVFRVDDRAVLAYKVHFRVDRNGSLFDIFDFVMDANQGDFLHEAGYVIYD